LHTYPLRSTESAWRIVQAGEAVIVNAGLQEHATVRSVSLGYFDSFNEQEYLQPIYIFEGDGGFMAYVSAIDTKFIQAGTAQ
nr:hypothetical protein [bacterium]